MKNVVLIILLLSFLLSIIGCSAEDKGEATDVDGDTGSDTDTDSDTDSSSDMDSDTDSVSDTGSESEDTDPVMIDITWRLHEELESIIYVGWTQTASGRGYVEYLFEGDEWLHTPERIFEEGVQEQIVLGVPYNTNVKLRLVSIVDGAPVPGDTVGASTGELPLEMLQPSVLESNPWMWEPMGKYLLGSINTTNEGWADGEYWLFILDRKGRVVWAYKTPWIYFSYYVRVSYDGNDILWDEITYWTDWDLGEGSLVFRMKIDGTILTSYPIPGANHAFTELPDESIAWWGMTEGGHLRILRHNGKQEVLWSCPDFYKDNGLNGSCLANTVYFRESTDSFLVSFALMDFIVEVDHSTGETLKVFGDVPGAWDFDPVDSAFYMNHGATYTDTQTLLLSTHVDEFSDETIVREYSLDYENEVLEEIWNYGIGEGINVEFGGEAHRLQGGNTLHNYGVVPRLKEISPDGEVVWDLEWPVSRLLGRTIFLDDLYALAP